MSKSWVPKIAGGDQPVYVAITQALENDIVSGDLRAGDRLPTHRELADRMGLAVGTVTKAYREAERRGLIQGNGRRGTFVRGFPRHRETLLTDSRPEPGIIDLSPYYTPTVTNPDLSHALSQLAGRDTRYLVQYTGPRGYARHREAGARWLATVGMDVDESAVIITAGAQHAIIMILAALGERGDIIATATHTYPGLKWAAELLGLRLVGVASDGEGLLPDAFEAICSKQQVRFLYCIPTLHNPTNVTLGEARRRSLAEVAEKYDVKIIEDEINCRLLSNPALPISSFVPERSFLAASLAKVVAGGLRICYLSAPPGYHDRLYQALRGTTLMVSPLLAELATIWINDGTTERVIAHKRAEAEKRNRVAAEVLKNLSFTSFPTSYFIWLKLTERWATGDFFSEAHRRGVIVAPSDIFAVDPASVEKAVRVCLGGHTDMEALRRGLELIASVMRGATGPESSVF
ncbi:MAG: PLP-dependent aminotransferase family protein [Candidatus Zixiibacteriota bacterium]|nr:MAG: PLP-dependent aminotransferase family protein [candidate division Zixibacteria bacterium]